MFHTFVAKHIVEAAENFNESIGAQNDTITAPLPKRLSSLVWTLFSGDQRVLFCACGAVKSAA
jgi:hypothetical protein